jgi:FixJ family two-component response regulator
VALTANAFPEDARLCREAGMSDFLAKPLRKQTLAVAVLRALAPAHESSEPSMERAPPLVSAMPATAAEQGAAVDDEVQPAS